MTTKESLAFNIRNKVAKLNSLIRQADKDGLTVKIERVPNTKALGMINQDDDQSHQEVKVEITEVITY